MILRYFVLKCSQIEYISYIFHTYSTTTPYFALYRLRFLLFSFEIWYTHSYRVFIHLGSRNIIFLHNNQFLSIKWIIKYLIIEIWHFGPSGPTRPSCRCWMLADEGSASRATSGGGSRSGWPQGLLLVVVDLACVETLGWALVVCSCSCAALVVRGFDLRLGVPGWSGEGASRQEASGNRPSSTRY